MRKVKKIEKSGARPLYKPDFFGIVDRLRQAGRFWPSFQDGGPAAAAPDKLFDKWIRARRHLAAFVRRGVRGPDGKRVGHLNNGSTNRATGSSEPVIEVRAHNARKGVLMADGWRTFSGAASGQCVIHAIKRLRVHGGCLGVERR